MTWWMGGALTVLDVNQPEDVRLELRAKAQASTYFMAKAVIGFADLTIRTHAPFGSFMDAPAKRKFGLAPRDHLKTSVWTIADSVRQIALNPNIRILLANETATNASKMLRRIAAVFERCSTFQWLFPELIQDFNKAKKWSEVEMLVPRTEDFPESTVEAIGVGGAVVSRHYDLIKMDDLVGKEASESDEIMRKTVDWYQYCESILNHPTQSGIHVYGTRWSYRDLYAWIDEHEPRISKFHRSAIQPDGLALWPERFPLEVLEDIRLKVGAYKFSCQYQNAPNDPEGSSFKPDWINYFTFDGDVAQPAFGTPANISKMRRFMRIDPAVADTNRSARNAIIVDAVDGMGRKFVLEAWARRCEPKDLFDQIFSFQRKWDCESVSIETIAYQKAIKYFLADECQRRNIYLNIKDLRPEGKASKDTRITGLKPYFQRGEIFFQKTHDDLIQEYLAYPLGQTVDLIDALAYGPQVWEPADFDGAIEDEWDEPFGHMEGRSALTGY